MNDMIREAAERVNKIDNDIWKYLAVSGWSMIAVIFMFFIFGGDAMIIDIKHLEYDSQYLHDQDKSKTADIEYLKQQVEAHKLELTTVESEVNFLTTHGH